MKNCFTMRGHCYILIASLALLIITPGCSSGEGSDKELKKAANELNKACPKTIDSETRLDNAAALPGNVFLYNCTLINYEMNDMDTQDLREAITPNVIKSVTSDPALEAFRDQRTEMIYSYSDKNGRHLFRIHVTPDMYVR